MNELAQDGWEYQRAESLPDEEKKGFMGGKEVVTRNILVFRRELYFEDTAEDTPAEARAAAPLTLSRKVEPRSRRKRRSPQAPSRRPTPPPTWTTSMPGPRPRPRNPRPRAAP
jgi:hypothetical protein